MPTTPVAIAFGRVLRECRERADMSQETLAAEADLARGYVGMLERGVRQPTLETVIRLANALNVSASTLVTRTIAEL